MTRVSNVYYWVYSIEHYAIFSNGILACGSYNRSVCSLVDSSQANLTISRVHNEAAYHPQDMFSGPVPIDDI
jgi:hypothetical protein